MSDESTEDEFEWPHVVPGDVEQAALRTAGHLRRTPLIEYADPRVLLKLELLQHAGSFKPRGAFNRVLGAGPLPASGLIAASGGNHGAALAYVGRELGVAVEVFVPSTSPAVKRANIERFGATVTIVEGYYDDAQREANLRQSCTAALMVHPFDHEATVAGQGTMARELELQLAERLGLLPEAAEMPGFDALEWIESRLADFDTLVVASGGGGFTAGQAAWLQDRVRVVSVEPESSQCVRAALGAGRRVEVPVGGIAADTLGSRRVGGVPWSIIRHFVDEAVVVTDEDIRDAQYVLWDDYRLVTEPGGAAALAALRAGAYSPAEDERVVVVVCGANCDPNTVMRP